MRPRGRTRIWILGIGLPVAIGGTLAAWKLIALAPGLRPVRAVPERSAVGGGRDAPVRLAADRQRAIGLEVAPVTTGRAADVLTAPGRVVPDETRYALITPRAAGVVRSAEARIGQEVKAGDLLATIDSPEVGQTRLDLVTQLKALEVARTQAEWQDKVYRGTIELLDRMERGDTPEQIHERFKDRPVGVNRERLLTAYAQYRLAGVTAARFAELHRERATSLSEYQRTQAEFEVARATYQALMDQMGVETRLEQVRAQQALQKAETTVRVTHERLRILGVDSDVPIAVTGATASAAGPPVSVYEVRSPLAGTILDREALVPGVAVNMAHRMFTIADLSRVWIEVDIHEGNFDRLLDRRDAAVRFTSPAYPRRTFAGKVIYTGDLVDEKSRTIRLLAAADNPDRALKPGMFVEVAILGRAARETALVPRSALVSADDRLFAYVRTAPDRFERREVAVGESGDDLVPVLEGLEPGQEVVVEGAFKLESEAIRLASSAS